MIRHLAEVRLGLLLVTATAADDIALVSLMTADGIGVGIAVSPRSVSYRVCNHSSPKFMNELFATSIPRRVAGLISSRRPAD